MSTLLGGITHFRMKAHCFLPSDPDDLVPKPTPRLADTFDKGKAISAYRYQSDDARSKADGTDWIYHYIGSILNFSEHSESSNGGIMTKVNVGAWQNDTA